LLSDGTRVLMYGPRNYEAGSFVLTARDGAKLVSSRESHGERLELIASSGQLSGFRLGAETVYLQADEIPLVAPVEPGDNVVTRMICLKRVGLFRLMSRWLTGLTGYSTLDATNDVRASSRW